MRAFFFACLSTYFVSTVCGPVSDDQKLIKDESKGVQFLDWYNTEFSKVEYTYRLIHWDYNTNITDYNQKKVVEADVWRSKFVNEAVKNASRYDWRNFRNDTVQRLFRIITDVGWSALSDPKKVKRLSNVRAEMKKIYSEASVCNVSGDHCIDMETGLTPIMANDRDYDTLLRAWKGWRDTTGKQMRTLYTEYVDLMNEGVKEAPGDHSDTGDYLRGWYESPTFQEDLQELLKQLRPLYSQLHAYVRARLQKQYPQHRFPKSGHIPAHILGNMWAQNWENVYHLVQPYKNKPEIDVTSSLKEQNYNATTIFRTAENFFTSLGLPPLLASFWENSMLSKPTDGRSVVCHASAWDLGNSQDFRIKMCTTITMPELIVVHHEMGHIMYDMLYKDQPVSFRDGANPGFHEAIGDLMALSVSTPTHLKALGLLDSAQNDTESDLNFLMAQALRKIAFLPFGYLIDQWRWGVFSGNTTKSNYNSHWWNLRCRYQGIYPPVERSEDDFDPGAKYHIPSGTPYIRYFISHILQFQFHKALCQEKGHAGPLYLCDIYNSKAAGDKLKHALKLGSSRPWPEVLKMLTGTPKMDAGPLMEYFSPLIEWLKKTNEEEDNRPGWTPFGCPSVKTGRVEDEEAARQFARDFNDLAETQTSQNVEINWEYNTNITEFNQKQVISSSVELAEFKKEMADLANLYDWQLFTDEDLRRVFSKITDIGTAVQGDQDKLAKMNEAQSDMESVYSTANVCLSDGSCHQIEPGLTQLLATSTNYTLLSEAWTLWRDATGPKMKSNYEQLVTLSNEAIKLANFSDIGAYWRSWYETPTFQEDLEKLLNELKPLYENLHAYVRRKLKQVYDSDKDKFPTSGHIPAHLLGNMWAQQWNNIAKYVLPYPDKESIDVTPKLKEKGYDAKKLFEISEEFFLSLGLIGMPETFWEDSMITKPTDREVVCHASAWDFYNRKDFRIKMCTEINMEDLITIHHEMGHIEYFLQYKEQPIAYREGANPGFHEAVGDVMALSVSTPEHLHEIGLLDKLNNDTETDLNFLMSMALDKIAFLPFGYLIDQWRWSVFSGETPYVDYNKKWWELRCKYQGISPPVDRTSDDFDPGAKYHVPANVPYIRYFVSFVIQFQFHQALCKEAGKTNVPLHRCDIYRSTNAGQKLSDMLKLGSSVSWQEAMEKITGQREMSAKPLLEYFQPLTDWLEKQNQGESVGWTDDCPGIGQQRGADSRPMQWLQEYNSLAQQQIYTENEVEWNYATNITDENSQKLVDARLKYAKFGKEASQNASRLLKEYNSSLDLVERRRLKKIATIGTDALKDEAKLKQLNTLQSEMEGIYGKAKVCVGDGKCLPLEPDIYRIIATSRNYTELELVWKGWRDASGRRMKDKYAEFVNLSNHAIQDLDQGFKDTGDYWRSAYESASFQEDLVKLLEELKPLYEELHTYIRRRLRQLYGEEKFPRTGHIPAHILGNMWAQQWNNIYDLVIPFKSKSSVDVTPQMIAQHYNASHMFRVAEEFFTSLGLTPMPEAFWEKSMIVKPDGREVVCHASAWDFYNQKDYRIKMCTTVTMENLITIHHEMGHIQYFLQYRDQPVKFRDGANPGFHEAIGDTMALSVSTPKHLHKLGLLDKLETDDETDLNFLMSMALEKIAFLPFGYLIDQWRWSVFSGETTPDKYNQKWWELRCKYQGISPPVDRSEEDFDPGAKYHIPDNTPYIRYFVSYVVQFQFHKALCEAAGQTGPLHQCDIYQSKAAGKKLGDMLKLGSSVPWQDAMEQLTGQRKMSADAVMEYFKPLTDWLKIQNRNDKGGWQEECPQYLSDGDKVAKQWLEKYDKAAEAAVYKESEVEWTYATNITDENEKKLVASRLELAQFEKEAAKNASNLLHSYNVSTLTDGGRQLFLISDIGTSALRNRTVLEKLNTLQSEIEGMYGKAELCLENSSCLSLEPDMYRIMSTSRNYTELQTIWKGWRDVSGKKMKQKYAEFVKLSNQGIQELGLGYRDTGDYWRAAYESDTFQDDLRQLLEQLKPLYQELHTYVRGKLRNLYGADKFPDSGHIPAHLLGNMWGQEWQNLYDLLIPYKGKTNVDITPVLKARNYTALRMFHTAEDFFTSLGLKAMPQPFWDKSMIVKPEGRDVVCHASAWDFSNRKDFRIKMCTDITMEDLITVHHEMGHIQYYLQYMNQSLTYRSGANPGFHEAIGDTMALSASTPQHLHKIGLLENLKNDRETDLNYLMKMALEKIAFLPFGYLIDQWRWSVFSGETTPDDYNDKWWALRCKYQGISPAVERTADDFDPGAKYHIPSNTPYIRYFVSFVIQFQFHKALCEEAGQTGPLYQCDIYQSKAAGKKLGDMLKLGSSLPWQHAMEKLTGQRKMDVGPLIEYFSPLLEWLKVQNQNETGGWREECPTFLEKVDTNTAKQWLKENNQIAQIKFSEETEVEWTYATNITDENAQKQVKARFELAEYEKDSARKASYLLHALNISRTSTMGRELYKVSDIGTSALTDKSKLQKLNELQSEIEGIYGKAEFCVAGDDCLSLDPDMYRIMSTSRNFTELKMVWKGWRDVSGKKMREKYSDFVKLSNEGVRELNMGYTDTGEYWRSKYESDTFQEDLKGLLEQLKPLYQELHTYVRKQLRKQYGTENFPVSGHIPAHLLGNMWAQEWQNIYDLVIPFKNKENVDITPVLKQKNFTALRMFKTAEGFFTSIGLKSMPKAFWDKSMIEKPKGRDVVCHASAWDFYNQKDFRIKMCTDITMEDLITIHHEMGHIQYYLQYMDQPVAFRRGANPGFHEAIGDTMALSASTPQHLQKIGLLGNLQNSRETDLNYLMKMALEKIAFLPFGYLIDQWRWSVFSGETTPDDYNDKWWALRCQYQGISPPVERGKEDFDPGAKYHIPSNTPYIRYFVSFVIQFQFHKALCEEARQTGPLYQCDIYQSKAAGKKLGDMLKLGSSLPWQQVMEKLTGQRKMDVGPLIEYFSPLLEWLKVQNQNETGGWREECPTFLEKVDVNTAKQWLKENNEIAQIKFSEETEVEWTYATNITDENAQKQVKARFELAEYEKDSARKASYLLHALNISQTSTTGRELYKVSDIGTSALTDKSKLQKLNELQSEIEGIYGKAEFCVAGNDCLSLDPDMYRVMSTSRNFTELKMVWKGWRDVSGKKMKEKYSDFVKLSNEGVRELNMGYNDTGEYWRSKYESDTFQEDLKGLLEQLKPLYQELHTYVRKQLRKQYGTENFPVSGHIPAHLLGNMWAQQWQNIYDLVIPFKNKANIDITPVLKERNYTALRMFRTAEEFFTSLGLKPMPEAFWKKSMIVKPKGRDVVCHASAWDFYNQKDFRIKMCTDITMEDLITIHHEMGHIQYYLQYMDQPVAFRRGANPGFHEAIGDTMALSVSTPKHLHRIGLLQSLTNDQETDLNFLMKMALEKIAFLPFGYLIDQWRWSVFSGETTPDKYNQKWWELRCKYQGVSPPVTRTEEDFDPGAKYHIPSNTPYIRYFVSFVIQFQFHKTLCDAAGQTGPLHQCDIYQSKAAGEKLRNLLKQGSSKPWPEIMKELTGQSKMDVSAILQYFEPLHNWLKEQNKGEKKGWETNCNGFNFGQLFVPWLKNYEGEAEKVFNHRMQKLFDYESNITDFNEQKKTEASLALTAFRKDAYDYVKNIDIPNIKNERDRRQFEKIADIGTGALKSKQELERMEELESEMIKIYSTAKVPINGAVMELEPGLTEVLTESSDYDKLLQVWKGFRDAVGPAVRPLYVEFIYLANKAIRDLGYGDYGQWERRSFDTDTLPRDVEKILNGLMPMYRNLHAYARKKLMAVYGPDKFPKTGHIPAHLLGNMWAQKWDNIYRLLQPFKNKELIDVTQDLIRQNYTVERMFKTAESFFTSLGMDKMTDKFWKYSMIRKPSDRKALCHAAAFDLFADNDFRIKMCTVKTHESLIIIHHEMGHIQYFMEYKDQPVNFRRGANPGFHEAIGDTISLSVQTPGHLQKIGLLHPASKSSEADLNFLMKMALEKIAFLPFAFIMDNWRWGVFRRDISPDDFNSKWWQLRCKYQGISPPIRRTENDFDPGAKYHIPANYQYISYFMSYIMQFQFHKALCNASGHTGPLHTCDIYQSQKAGKLLSDMLKLGASVPWPDAMEQITGQRNVDIGPLLEYFQPLNVWLENEVKDDVKDWSDECPDLPPPTPVTHTKDAINSASFTYIAQVYIVTGTLATVLFAFLI